MIFTERLVVLGTIRLDHTHDRVTGICFFSLNYMASSLIIKHALSLLNYLFVNI